MLRRMCFLGALALAGLTTAACTIKSAPDPSGGGTTEAEAAPPSNSNAVVEGNTEETSGGAGGEAATSTETCAGCDSGLCLDDGTCVDCLASNDHCPHGEYCGDGNECVAGCKGAADCASGSCGKDHNCNNCIDDRECTDGSLCSAGVCSPACSADADCSNGLSCCSLRCTELTTDTKNCGACGNACDDGQFCGLSSCVDTTLANVCSVARIVVILDTSKNTDDGNRVPGRAMGAALAEQCPTAPKLEEAEQDSVEALNITTGRPVSDSSELLVVAGGPFYQNLEGYLEEQKIAPLAWKVNEDVTEFRLNKTGEVVVSQPIAGDHDSHDIFIIQFMRDPDSGSLALNAQGFWLSGTIAAAYHLNSGLLPDLSSQHKAWYAYEWTDKDGDKAPDSDEIELLASGD